MTEAPTTELLRFHDEPTPPARPRRLPYHAGLDGLRALAVVGVLVYHQNPVRLPGGFLGVDVFFALSGFLITSLLLAEHEATGGIALRRFWVRRAQRLLPALLLTLLLVAAYARWLAAPGSLGELRGDGLASLAYVLNWRFVLQGRSYFFEFFPSPLRHLWSLAVEEQWYLLWPFVLAVVLRGRRGEGRSGARRVLVASGVLALVSAAEMAWLFTPGADPSRAYYGTDTHASPILAGAALAALLALRTPSERPASDRSAVPALLGAVGLVGVLWAFQGAQGSSPWLYRGGFLGVGIATCALIVGLISEGGPWWSNPVRAVLSLAPVRALGRISYGVYLYHWPLWFVLTPERTGAVGWRLFALRFAATVALATASYLLVERPVRAGVLARHRSGWLVGAAAVGATVLLLLAATTGATAPWTTRDDLDVADRPPPSLPAPSADDAVEDLPSRVLVVGDSVAYTLAIGFEGEVGEQERLAVWNQAILYCELVPLPRREDGEGGEERTASDRCADWRSLWGDAVEEFDPEVAVVQVGPWEVFDRREGDRWVPFGSERADELLGHELDALVDVLGSQGATVVLLTAPPLERTDGVTAAEWTRDQRWRTEHLNDLLDDAAARAAERGITVEVVDLAGYVCPSAATGCPEEVDGVRLRGDGIHYTDDGAVAAARWLAPILRELALPVARARDGVGPSPSASSTAPPDATTSAPPAPTTGPTTSVAAGSADPATAAVSGEGDPGT